MTSYEVSQANPLTTLSLGVIQVQTFEVLEPHCINETRHVLPPCTRCSKVDTRTMTVGGVDAHANAAFVVHCLNYVAQV